MSVSGVNNVKSFDLSEDCFGVPSNIADEKTSQVAQTHFENTVSIWGEHYTRYLSEVDLSQMKFSEISSKYNLGDLVLAGRRRELQGKFVEQFGKLTLSQLIEMLSISKLKWLNDLGIFSDEHLSKLLRAEPFFFLDFYPDATLKS